MSIVENVLAPTLPVIAKDHPPEGTQCVPFNLVLTPQLYALARTYQINTGKTMSQVRTLTVDNSTNPKPLTVTHGIANQTATIPAGGGGIIPTTSSAGGYFFSIATADPPASSVAIGLLLSNYEIPPALYGTQIVTILTSVPAGVISLWYGSAGSIPNGYGLCDGSTYQRADGTGQIKAPDMRGLFAYGADASASTSTGANGSGGSNVITQAMLPNVTLKGQMAATTPEVPVIVGTAGTTTPSEVLVGAGNSARAYASAGGQELYVPAMTVAFSKADVPLGGTGSPHLPPYLALCYIMKL